MKRAENNDNASTYFNQGINNHKQEKYQEAIDNYNKSASLGVKKVEAFTKIGLIKYEKEDETGAILKWGEALSLDSEALEPKMAVCAAYHALGERQKALQLAKQIIEIDRKWADLDFLKRNLWGERLRLSWLLLIFHKISLLED